MKNNDVFHWSYNEDTLKAKNDGNNGGTTYWCCSRIAIFKHDYLYDIFWSSMSDNKAWSLEDADKYLELRYLGNLDDYEKVDESYQCCYEDKDCLNLNHSNSSRGNFYIRKGAKMEKILRRNIKYINSKISSELTMIEKYKGTIENLSESSYVSAHDNSISMSDESWWDHWD